MRIIHGGHTIDGRAHNQNIAGIEVWNPQTATHGGRRFFCDLTELLIPQELC